MRIDAHQHFWQYSPEQYGWISDPMTGLRRDFLPDDLAPLLRANDIQGCVAVQARQSLEETRWLLELAAQTPMIKGVVGWIDLCREDLPAQLQQFRNNPHLKGFRHVLQDEPDPDFMLRPEFIRGVEILADQGYSYDILINAGQLPQACELVRRLPAMNLVIDHIAKPDITARQWQGWQEPMLELAGFEHVHCKVSGMVTEADWDRWQTVDMHPYMKHVFDCFGPQRLMFGSDWPVCQVAAPYGSVLELVESFVRQHGPDAEAQVMGGNARDFYRLA